ncbi:MAG: nuclear transport factor 2 family protein [Bdellovibrionota bacterium]
MNKEVEIVREIYAALNRNEIPKVMEFLDPDIVRIEFEGSPMAGTFRGLQELEAHFSQGRNSWAEGTCEPEKLLIGKDKVMAFVHVRVRLKDQQEWLEGDTGDVFTFRNGKVIEFRTFADTKEALKWSGIKE